MDMRAYTVAPLLPDEPARLAALQAYAVLDTAPELAFDDFTVLASRIAGTPIALISLVDADRQWFKSKVGTDDEETPRDVAFCAHAIHGEAVFEVEDARLDPRFAGNPLVTGEASIRFYAGAPLRTPEGHAVGTLCVIDREPRRLSAEARDMLERLARQVVHLLELRRVARQQRDDERALQAGHDKAQALLQALPVGVIVYDAALRAVQANAAAAQIAGLAHADLIGLNTLSQFGDAIGEDGQPLPAALRPHALTLADGAPRDNVVYGLRMAHGERRWLRVSTAAVRDAAGAVGGVISCFADLTEERRQRRLLSLAVDAARIAPWHWDLGNDVVQFDRGATDAAGLCLRVEGQGLLGTSFWPAVHRDDLHRVRKALQQHLAAPATPLRTEFRLPGTGGGWRWVMAVGAVGERDAAGRALRLSGVLLDITDRKLAEQTLQRAATTDTLTGLPNRSVLADRLSQALNATRRHRRAGGLLFIDLDHFKRINDVYGHLAGDRVLQAVSQRLQAALREEDTLARMGGDELTVLLPDLGSDAAAAAAGAMRVGQKLQEALARPFEIDGVAYSVGGSIGCTHFPKTAGENADDLVREADTAMYAAKSSGRGTLRLYEDGMQRNVARRVELEQDLRRALVGNEFALHLQGKWHTDGQLAGAEVLLRWTHPQRGAVSPAEFIPVAEESSLIVGIGRWVLERTCALLAGWLAQGRALPLAVNVSPRQFREPGFATELVELVRASGIPTSLLTLEITEGVLLDEGASRRLEELAALGFRFSIDDFGTGYSSLMYLKKLPVCELKIDRAFVRDLTDDPEDATIVCAILAIARKFQLDTVAEGVETRAQAEFLTEQGCTLLQGFLYGRPQPVEVFERQLQPVQPAQVLPVAVPLPA